MAIRKITEWITAEGLEKVEGRARDGLTDEQIATKMGISARTLYRWKKEQDPICQSLKKGKEVIDFEVENALLKKALGYTKTLNKQKVTNLGEVINYKEEMYISPDTTAMIFWLKNRKPSVWREKILDTENKEAINNANEILVKIRKVAGERKGN